MGIQQNSPATLRFNLRHYDESGTDLGPIDLTDAEHDPVQVVLRKPGGDLIVIEEAEVDVIDEAGGVIEWTADGDTFDKVGTWKAQAWAGEWPSRVVGFAVNGPNLT
jgi:hypothetical protein